MKDERLEQWLRAADRSAGRPENLGPDLAGRVRQRHDRRQSRATLLRGVVVAYLAGAATMWAIGDRRIAPVGSGPVAVEESQRPEGSRPRQPVVRNVSDSPRSAAQQPMTLPVFTEREYERMRRLGDRYLRSRGDVMTALEFYKRALEAASDEERAVSKKDSWLLRSLKEDHYLSQRESSNGGSI